MKRSTQLWLAVLIFIPFLSLSAEDVTAISPWQKGRLKFEIGDSVFDFAFRLVAPEWFAGKNITLLNNENHEDRVFFIRHTIDTSFHYGFGKHLYDHEIIKLHMNMRDRGVWGDPESIASTTNSPVKGYEVVFGDHKHALTRHIWWIRELWMDMDINEVFGFDFDNCHYLTIGAFSYKLGRGIAFGDAYAVTPDPIVGFSLEGSVDQYAFGGLIHGDIIPKILTYDLYGAILNNKAGSFSNTGAKIRGQEYGKKFDQFRGFAVVNFALTGKLRFQPCDSERQSSSTEFYYLYNNDPEQLVEVLGDAESKLGTVGAAGEYALGNFEFGFDTAFNLGRQKVKGLDRNFVTQENRDGFVSVVNTAVNLTINPGTPQESTRRLPYKLTVVDQNGTRIDAQRAVNVAFESASQNGAVLLDNVTLTDLLVTGQNTPVPVRINNGNLRFRDPYENKYRGYMIVTDACYWFPGRDLKIGAAYGLATGDANPNRNLQFPRESIEDRVFDGFIGIQEFYSGTRVRSAFFLSGAGKIPRVLDIPERQDPLVATPFASTVQRFTNIVFTGYSLWYVPKDSPSHWDINPNVLWYWQDFAGRRFDIQDLSRKGLPVSSYLGLEANVFINAEPSEGLRFFNKIGIFFPGQHYTDVKGRPITAAQARFIDRPDRTGVTPGIEREPLLGDDIAFATNFGLEYLF